jgi:RNA polymerase sigma-70 factor, ECF subfamily
VASGDPIAMRECLDQFGGLVWSLARRFSPTDAEDAAQDVFVALWKGASRYDPSVGSESTFVAMIARRRLIDRARARGRALQPGSITDTHAAPPAPTADLSDETALAARAISQLSPDQQKAMHLSICRGLSHEEIAQATGMPLGTVKTHIRRGLARVRELLASTSLQGGAA